MRRSFGNPGHVTILWIMKSLVVCVCERDADSHNLIFNLIVDKFILLFRADIDPTAIRDHRCITFLKQMLHYFITLKFA